MRIDVRRLGDADLVLVEGVLDLATTPRLRAVLDARLGEGRTDLVLDLSGSRLLDAGAGGMLIGVAERAAQAGGALRAVGARGLSLDVLQIVSLDKRLRAYDEPDEILAEFPVEDAEPDPYHPAEPRWPGSRDITVHGLLSAAARPCRATRPSGPSCAARPSKTASRSLSGWPAGSATAASRSTT